MGNNLLTMNKMPAGVLKAEIADVFPAESVVDSLSSGVIFSDGNGILTFMNRSAEMYLQVFKEMVIGKRIDMLPLRTPLYKVMSEECIDYPLEMNICGRVLEVRAFRLFSWDNRLLGLITELFDVTKERLEKRRREEFVAKMTHDLKSPLMVLQGYLQAIQMGMCGSIDSGLKVAFKDMERSSKNLYSMIEDLLDVYRLEMGLVQIKRQRCDIRALLENICADRRMEAADQKISFSLRVARGLPAMELDPKQLGRVFSNIIGNAVKFTPREGKVTVRAWVKEDCLHVSVKDTGIGIYEKDIHRVFDKYYRTEQAAGFKGSGLGLALSKEIVEAHGGSIDIKSIVGKGTEFTVVVPLCEECE
ncbi:MAG: ATP-binding protein [Geobacteraceae bacterium]|nr:ATP-binding protein [Geobacteraceae bacterium]